MRIKLVLLSVLFSLHALGQGQIAKTKACPQIEKTHHIQVPKITLWAWLSHNVDELLVDPSQHCLQVGKTFLLSPIGEKTPWLEVKTKKITSFNKEVLKKTDKSSYFLFPWFKADSTAKAELEIKKVLSINPNLFSRSLPRFFSGIRVIGKRQIQAFKKTKPLLADVNRIKEFAGAFGVKDSTFFNYNKQHKDFLFSDDPKFKSGDSLSIDFNSIAKLPFEKNKTIIIYGLNPSDTRPLHFASRMVEKGYHNLYIYEGGAAQWNREIARIPKKSRYVNIVDANDVIGLQKAGGFLVDVRAIGHRHIDKAIKGSTTSPYIVQDNARKLASIGSVYTGKFDLKGLPLSKKANIVFIGDDELDWRPYKAALEAQNLGWKNVHVFRGGIAEWYFFHFKDRQQFAFNL